MALPHTNSTTAVNPNSGSDNNNENITQVKKRCWQNIIFTIYISHILTSWGDRMWGFAVGLYLIILFPESLQYTAIFGFTTCVSVIIGGPFIGKWVDKSSRLKVAKCALVTQNLAVMCCAILLIIFINYDDKSNLNSSNKVLNWMFLILIIIFAVTGELASVASKIALEKDWIVVLAHGDEQKLSKMNATMRTIDLTTSIMAPAVVAQIIAFVSQTAGAGFIAGWNMLSGMVEIYLLHKIYKAIPELSLKKIGQDNVGNNSNNNNDNSNQQQGTNPSTLNNGNKNIPHIFIEGSSPNSNLNTPPYNEAATAQLSLITTPHTNNNNNIRMEELIPTPTGQTDGLLARDFAEISLRTPSPNRRHSNTGLNGLFKSPDSYVFGSSLQQLVVQDTKKKNSFVQHIRNRIVDAMTGWKQYYKHPLRNAGVGLALLYMTVLGFDTITIGYMYSHGVSESLIGILTAVGAVFGILGSISFPFLRRIFGKSTVGIFGFGFETLCLVLCVLSIFMPGSSFIPEALWEHNSEADQNGTSIVVSSSSESPSDETAPYDSIIMFTVGILLSRYGLWIADLSVTQYFQEEVHESQRGILNGVQDALNQFLSLIKFILVIILPTIPTFGYLIALSWCFVFMGWISFIIFSISWRRRQNKIKCTTVPAITTN